MRTFLVISGDRDGAAAPPLAARDQEALAPFRPGPDGEWNRAAAAHLARRAGFGMPPAEVEKLLKLGPAAAAENWFGADEEEPESERLLQSARLFGTLESAQSWWTHQLLNGKNALREKMALFWHGHFATSNRKVEDARLMLDQVLLFRKSGLGPFEDLVQKVAKDPAMLIWLDNNSNRRGQPNENFARELMELFTLSIGNYNEQDIKEAARAFTGWHIRDKSFWFNQNAHDQGEKRVFGKGGVRQGEEVVKLCVEQKASARYLAAKLFKFFVHPAPEAELAGQLGQAFEACGRHTGKYLKTILSSRIFYRPEARRSIISSPADFVLGALRTLGAIASPRRLAQHLGDMGQDLLQPPNVKGWDGGRDWISATSQIARLKFALELVEEKPLHTAVPWDQFTAREGKSLVDSLLERLLPDGLEAGARADFDQAIAGADLKKALAAALQLPEYQMV